MQFKLKVNHLQTLINNTQLCGWELTACGILVGVFTQLRHKTDLFN